MWAFRLITFLRQELPGISHTLSTFIFIIYSLASYLETVISSSFRKYFFKISFIAPSLLRLGFVSRL